MAKTYEVRSEVFPFIREVVGRAAACMIGIDQRYSNVSGRVPSNEEDTITIGAQDAYQLLLMDTIITPAVAQPLPSPEVPVASSPGLNAGAGGTVDDQGNVQSSDDASAPGGELVVIDAPAPSIDADPAALAALAKLTPPALGDPDFAFSLSRYQSIVHRTRVIAKYAVTLDRLGRGTAGGAGPVTIPHGHVAHPLVSRLPALLAVAASMSTIDPLKRKPQQPKEGPVVSGKRRNRVAPKPAAADTKGNADEEDHRKAEEQGGELGGSQGGQQGGENGGENAGQQGGENGGHKGDDHDATRLTLPGLDLVPQHVEEELRQWMGGEPVVRLPGSAEDLPFKSLRTVLDPSPDASDAWLGDEVINSILTLLVDYLWKLNRRALLVAPSAVRLFQAASQDDRYNPAAAADLFHLQPQECVGADMIFLPWHSDGPEHWSLLVVDVKNPRIAIYDSVPDDDVKSKGRDAAGVFAALNCRVATQEAPQLVRMKAMVQNDGSSCGLALCYHAALHALGKAPDVDAISQRDALQMRLWLLWILREGGITTEMMRGVH